MQNAADREAKEFVNRAHPFAIACSEVVVDGDHVDSSARESVEIDRQSGDQSFALAGGHFSNSTRMQRVAANELNVEGDHLPLNGVFANGDFFAPETAAGIFDYGKGF